MISPIYANIDVSTTASSTTLTVSYRGAPICYDFEPNLDHPAFKENPDRVDGVEAALNYLHKKGIDIGYPVQDLWRIKC